MKGLAIVAVLLGLAGSSLGAISLVMLLDTQKQHDVYVLETAAKLVALMRGAQS